MKINEAIRQARQLAGMEQKDLALLIGSSQPHISRIESGAKVPGADLISKIEDATRFSIVPHLGGWEVISRAEITEMLKFQEVEK